MCQSHCKSDEEVEDESMLNSVDLDISSESKFVNALTDFGSLEFCNVKSLQDSEELGEIKQELQEIADIKRIRKHPERVC